MPDMFINIVKSKNVKLYNGEAIIKAVSKMIIIPGINRQKIKNKNP
jgi:hypothetical protein